MRRLMQSPSDSTQVGAVLQVARPCSKAPCLSAVPALPRGPADAQTHAASTIGGASLWQSIQRAYDAAAHAGVAVRTVTEVAQIHDASRSVNFILRQSANLQAKPTGPKERKGPWRNPFLPYEEALWVTHLCVTHTLLLNKFNLVAHHVLVVTRAFESQDEPLNADDLAATATVVHAMPEGGLAFFNHGPLSGMSQPHKHIQVIPLPLNGPGGSMYPTAPLVDSGLAGSEAGQSVELRTFPFRAYGCRLPDGADGPTLAACFDGLAAKAGIAHGGELVASYNWFMTRDAMVLVPRGKEYCGPVTVNTLGYVGTFFVRSTEELECVQQVGPMAILTDLGQAWS